MTAREGAIGPRVAGPAPHTDDGRPLLVAIADDVSRRALLQTELAGCYGVAYRVVVMHSPIAAQAVLEEARAAGTRVSVVLASQWMAEMNGSTLLAWVRSRHPRSKRALLVAVDDWGRENTAVAIRSAIRSGCADHYLGRAPEAERRGVPPSDRRVSLRLDHDRGCLRLRGQGPDGRRSWPPRGAAQWRRPVRRRHRGSGAGRPGGGGVRLVRGPRDHRVRAKRDRRPGGIELHDPELPRVLPRPRRR